MPSTSSKTAPVVRGSEKARTGKEAVRRPTGSSVYGSRGTGAKAVPKWTVTSDYTPPRKITDKELELARKMFFDLDRDGSGSIDAEELGMMLRSLGQNPTEQELQELIESVDEGEKDGQIQVGGASGLGRARGLRASAEARATRGVSHHCLML